MKKLTETSKLNTLKIHWYSYRNVFFSFSSVSQQTNRERRNRISIISSKSTEASKLITFKFHWHNNPLFLFLHFLRKQTENKEIKFPKSLQKLWRKQPKLANYSNLNSHWLTLTFYFPFLQFLSNQSENKDTEFLQSL